MGSDGGAEGPLGFGRMPWSHYSSANHSQTPPEAAASTAAALRARTLVRVSHSERVLGCGWGHRDGVQNRWSEWEMPTFAQRGWPDRARGEDENEWKWRLRVGFRVSPQHGGDVSSFLAAAGAGFRAPVIRVTCGWYSSSSLTKICSFLTRHWVSLSMCLNDKLQKAK